MIVNVIKVGNSKAIRISKAILGQYGITDKVNLSLEKDRIVIKPVKQPRAGWSEAFAQMHANGHDKLLLDF